MGRKALFTTPESALASAISKGTPARGSMLPITSLTRGMVKSWISAHGVSSDISAPLTVSQLNDIWHDTTNTKLSEIHLAKAPAPAPIAPQEIKNVFQPELNPTPRPEYTPTPAPYTPSPAPNPAPQIEDPRLKLLAELFQPQQTPIDEAKIMEIVYRNIGQQISNATTTAADTIRAGLDDLLAEARSIVGGAPRVLKIELRDSVKILDAEQRHPLFDILLTMVICSREPRANKVMLVGPAGGGKTHACEQTARALDLKFYSNGALTGAHELSGYNDAAGNYHCTPFREAFENGGLYLADEMDRSDPSAILWLNSALSNGFAGFPDSKAPIKAHPDFVFVAACNTYGRGANRLYVGANQLDGATTDRLAPLDWDYDENLERALAGDDAWTSYVQAARNACDEAKIRHIISPRASYSGSTLRRAGLAFDLVASVAIWKGLDAEQRRRIEKEIPDGVTRRAQSPVMRAAHAIAAE